MLSPEASAPVVVGRIGAAYGVRGWLHVHSFMEPGSALLEFSEWLLADSADAPEENWYVAEVRQARAHNRGFVAHLAACDDRNRAEELTGLLVALPREVLPPAEEGEYYWCDLLGLRVRNTDGVALGVVQSLMETGANDVLVLRGEGEERLIPFVLEQVVQMVDLDAGEIVVDWAVDWDSDT